MGEQIVKLLQEGEAILAAGKTLAEVYWRSLSRLQGNVGSESDNEETSEVVARITGSTVESAVFPVTIYTVQYIPN